MSDGTRCYEEAMLKVHLIYPYQFLVINDRAIERTSCLSSLFQEIGPYVWKHQMVTPTFIPTSGWLLQALTSYFIVFY